MLAHHKQNPLYTHFRDIIEIFKNTMSPLAWEILYVRAVRTMPPMRLNWLNSRLWDS